MYVSFSVLVSFPSHLFSFHIDTKEAETNVTPGNASITGPSNTPYAGGQFDLRIHFSVDYPFSPPVIQFHTKLYHPNIETHGNGANICADILFVSQEWSPCLSIEKTLLSLLILLEEPNPEHVSISTS